LPAGVLPLPVRLGDVSTTIDAAIPAPDTTINEGYRDEHERPVERIGTTLDPESDTDDECDAVFGAETALEDFAKPRRDTCP
jgi:hypothetical protein